MSTARKLPLTPTEYLEGERLSEVRHEYVNGQVYAISGASKVHNLICFDVTSIFKNHLKGGPCETFIEAVKVEVKDAHTDAYYYPDVVVTCDQSDDDSYFVRKPKLVVEVLSPSNSRSDHFEKLEQYKRIPSLEEIVYIEQDWPEIFVVRRSDHWREHRFTQLDSEIQLESIDLTLKVSDFYVSNPFPDDVERPWYLRNRQDG